MSKCVMVEMLDDVGNLSIKCLGQFDYMGDKSNLPITTTPKDFNPRFSSLSDQSHLRPSIRLALQRRNPT
jgi:hypothetical protein